MLLPLEGSALRRALNQWFTARQVSPRIVAEFEDSALLKVIAQDGRGMFAAPTAVEREISRQYGVRVIGRIDEVQEHFYAISVERRLKDPIVVSIFEGARQALEGKSKKRGRR
jgi:LysR family transcriptional regulator, transcriptional activator of nhaA